MNLAQKPGVFRLNDLLGLLATGILLLATVSGHAQDKSLAETSTPQAFLDTLSPQERDWLREHPVITVALDPSWPPIEFTDERGTPSGMTADYLRLIEARLGVRFERVPNLSWQESYARLQRGEIDLATSVAVTAEREKFWAFTKPYMTIPIVVVTRADVTYIADLRELAGNKVAVVAGNAPSVWIARDFPEIQLVPVNTTQAALALLQRGEVFAAVENMLVVGHYLAEQKITNLKIAGSTPYTNAQCMAVRQDWAPLAGILDQVLDSVSPAEHETIYRRWLPLRHEPGVDYTRLWQIAAIFAAVLLGLVAWNWKLAKEIRNRKLAEAVLHYTQSLLKSVTEGTSDAIYVKDRQGRYLMFNAATARIVGKSSEEVLGQDDTALFPPEQARQVMAGDRRVMAADSVQTYEELVTSGGVARTFLSTKGPVHDAEGKVIGLFGVARDITERKQMEEVLRASETWYRELFASNPHPMWVYDLATLRFLAVNDAAVDQYGYTHDEFLRLTIADIRPPEEVPRLRKNLETVITGVEHAGNWRHRRKDGSVIAVEITSHTLDFAGCKAKLVLAQDITARQQAEAALHESNGRLTAVMANLSEGLAMGDAQGQLIYLNPAARAIFGYADMEDYPRKITEFGDTFELRPLNGDTPVPVGDWAMNRVLRGEVLRDWEVRLRRLDQGWEKILAYSGWLVRTASGENFAFVSTTDITARKRAEAELQKFALLADSSSDFIGMCDLALQPLYVNPAGRRMVGLPGLAAACRIKVQDYFFPEDQRFIAEEFFPRVLREGHGDVEIRLRHFQTGEPIWMSYSLFSVRDTSGEIVGWATVSRDITERRQADELLHRTDRALRMVSECNQMLVRATSETELLQAICRIVVEHGGYRMAWVGFAEQNEAKSVRPVAHAGLDDGYLEILNITWADTERGLGPVGTTLRTGRAVITHDIATNPAFAPWQAAATQRGYASLAAFPLISGGRAFGALTMYAAQTDAFNAEEVALLDELAGDLAYGITALRNQAERAQADKAMITSETRYRRLFESTKDGILILDAETGMIVDVNPYLIAMLGYTHEMFLGKKVWELGFFRNLVANEAKFTELQSKEYIRYEDMALETSDGRRIEVEFISNVYLVAERKVIQCNIREIAARVQAEKSTRQTVAELEQARQVLLSVVEDQKESAEQLRKLSAVIEQAPLSVVITNLTGEIEYVNPRFCLVSGYTPAEALGQNPRLLKSGETPAEVYRDMWQQLAAGQVWSGELHNRRKNGELYLESAVIAPVVDQRGQATHYVALKDDITAQRRLVADTTAQLAKEHELSEMKTRFISVTSHEFRTPMAAAMGSVEILTHHLERLAPAKRLELLGRITTSLQRMTVMLDDILLLNRMDANRVEVRLASVDVRLHLSNIVEEIRLGDQQGHEIDLQAAPDLGRFVTDFNLLHHILGNLLSNAVRYSPAHSVITLRATLRASQLELVIEDQGIGIPAADQVRIFEPFERGSNVGTIKGTGLGLSIIKRMTDLLGGTITLASSPTDGSRFTVTLPVQTLPPARS